VSDDPAAKVALWPIDRLRPHPDNPRIHDEAKIARLAANIDRHGWTVPILADEEGVIIAGHARLQAAKLLRRREVPVAIAEGWSETDKTAVRVADNQFTLGGSEWNLPILKEQLKGIDDGGYPLQLLNFSDTELEDFLGADAFDGGLDEVNPGAEDGARVLVGPYRVDVPGEAFARWQAMIREAAGDDEEQIRRLIVKWLKM
jgi:hypothetical protein